MRELNGTASYSAATTRLGRWLIDPGRDVPAAVRPMLLTGLYGTLVIFLGGVFNTIAVSTVISIRHPRPEFLVWAAYEILLGIVRLGILVHDRRSARAGGRTFTDAYVFLAIAWSAGVGYGSLVGLLSGDWLIGGLATISAAAMAGGIAFRNFYAPRLCLIMVVLSFGPAAIGAAMAGDRLLWLLVPQVPVYLFSLYKAITGLNAMLVRTIAAERENDRRASHDQLTGLANRTGLERSLDAWAARHDRHGPLSLFYLDLDGFKAVNDRHGHGAGDALLRKVARRLETVTPPDGLVARIGGDEFVLLVPEQDRGATLGHAESVIAAVATRAYVLQDGVSAMVGVSIGIARLPDHGRDLATLLAAADAALYEAKGRGRCRAVIAGTPEPPAPLRMVAAR